MDLNIKNEFSWSISRYNAFEECKRKYYLGYYGYWGGWQRGADKFTRETYVLRNLKNKYLWVGSVVHDTIQNILENLREGTYLPIETVLKNVRKRIKEDWIDSKQGKYWVNPKKYCGLVEDEYYEGLSEKDIDDILQEIEKYIGNFYKSKYFEIAKDLDDDQWLPVEEYANFMFEGTKVYVKIDFAYKPAPQSIIIVDWKTGQEEIIDDLQLTCYSMYSAEKWNVSPDKINAVYFFLSDMDEKIIKIDDEKIKRGRSIIRENIENMKNMLDDEENNIANIEKFPRTTDKKICGYCNYKRVCIPADGSG